MKINCSKILGKDKGCHFIVGFTIVLILAFAVSPGIGIVVGVLAGLGKELYDEYKYGGFDFFDLFATALGAIIGLFTYESIRYFI